MIGSQVVAEPVLLVDSRTALLVWRVVLEPWKRESRPGTVRPEVLEFIEQMGLLASMHRSQRSANGPMSRTGADPAPGSDHAPITTSELAKLLHVEPRSARRIAERHGITPSRRDYWTAGDVAALLELAR